MEMSKENLRTIIFYNFKRGLSRLQRFEKLSFCVCDAESCLRTAVRRYLGFQRGYSSLSDKAREGSSKPAMTQDNIEAKRQLILADQHDIP